MRGKGRPHMCFSQCAMQLGDIEVKVAKLLGPNVFGHIIEMVYVERRLSNVVGLSN